jgi:alkylation response protein AidB-like acyl-CoA dehydrogenase
VTDSRADIAPDIVAIADHIADEFLFPAALDTDRAGVVPKRLLDALADAGLYGLSAPVEAGGLDADFATLCAVMERLGSGCLTTTFVWVQHVGVVRAVAVSENDALTRWVAPLASGRRRAGLALGGAVPGPACLVATPAPGGWTFTGTSPFVSGWGCVDVIYTAARTDDGRLVWALVDARESKTLTVRRIGLVALDATATVRADFHGHVVDATRVATVDDYAEGDSALVIRVHANLPLGVARRCCRLLGPTSLDDELARIRTALDALDADTVQALRGSAAELAWRAAAAVAVRAGSRSLLLSEQGQRLAREALFCLVYALRPGSTAALLTQLGAHT